MDTTSNRLSDAIDIGILKPGETEFYASNGGFTGLRYKGTDYKRIILRRVLPVGRPNEYISVADSENKEIGIIRNIGELDSGSAVIVEAELKKRYYCPSIIEVKSVMDKLGYVYMQLVLQGNSKTYEKNCAIKDVNRNIRVIDEDQLIVFDVDGNRYCVDSLAALDEKSHRKLEPYLF